MSEATPNHRTLLDPTSESAPAVRERLERVEKLEGATIGLLDISKARGDLFLDRLEQLQQVSQFLGGVDLLPRDASALEDPHLRLARDKPDLPVQEPGPDLDHERPAAERV